MIRRKMTELAMNLFRVIRRVRGSVYGTGTGIDSMVPNPFCQFERRIVIISFQVNTI
jgi:hypothetical protein